MKKREGITVIVLGVALLAGWYFSPHVKLAFLRLPSELDHVLSYFGVSDSDAMGGGGTSSNMFYSYDLGFGRELSVSWSVELLPNDRIKREVNGAGIGYEF